MSSLPSLFSPMFSWCNDLDQMLLCGIRISPPFSLLSPLSLLPAPSLTLALWLTGISLVQYVCQWGSRLSCAPAYPWCLSLSLSHTHTHTQTHTLAGWFDDSSEQTFSLASIMIWCPVLLRCHSDGSVSFALRDKEEHFAKHCSLPCSLFFSRPPGLSLSPLSSVRWSSRWRRQMPSDGRSWRARDRSPTSNTSIPVSPELLHLHSFHPAVLVSLPSSVHLSLSPIPSYSPPPPLSLSLSLCHSLQRSI